jgi:hypothetical protein
MVVAVCQAKDPATVRGTYYAKEQGLEAYHAAQAAKKHCWGRFATVNPLLSPEREKVSTTGRGGGSVTITRVNRDGGFINLKFTMRWPVDLEFCVGAAQGGDGSLYLLRSKKDLLGVKRIKHKTYWTGYWIDPRPVGESVSQGKRYLVYGDDPPFTDFFLAGFRKPRK